MTDSKKRVVLTGMGLISPLGNTTNGFWEALTQQRSGVCPLRLPLGDSLPAFGAEARDFTGDIEDFGALEKQAKRNIKKGLKVMCREIAMGVAAAQRALNDAGWTGYDGDPERCGAVFGSDYIMTMPEEFTEAVRKCLDDQGQFHFEWWAERGIPQVTPLWLLKYLPNMPASHVAIYNDLRGPNNSITLREAAANLAIGEAYETILRGSAEMMIAGATGTRIHPLRTVHVVLQEQIAASGDDPARMSRPFDLHRTGMVIGEGAGAVVLESLQSAQARGAPILAEVIGHASSTVMDRQGVGRIDTAVRNVLVQSMKAAGLGPSEIGHVHTHGLATQKSDEQEAQAIRQVFDDRASTLPVVAAKANFGNLGSGGGLVELIGSVLALNAGHLFPVMNYETPDPQCPIFAVRSLDVPAGESFININVTPVGQASAVVVRRWEGGRGK